MPDDPGYLHARREAIVALLVWVLAMCWVIPSAYVLGYRPLAPGEEPALILGMPAWVFWSVALPWVVFSIVGIVLCAWLFQDDDLGEVESSPESLPSAGSESQVSPSA